MIMKETTNKISPVTGMVNGMEKNKKHGHRDCKECMSFGTEC